MAISNLRNIQIYANYVKGKILFDILDDNDFLYIATRSCQDMDGRLTKQNQVQKLGKNRKVLKMKKVNKCETNIQKNAKRYVKDNPKVTSVAIIESMTSSLKDNERKNFYISREDIAQIEVRKQLNDEIRDKLKGKNA